MIVRDEIATAPMRSAHDAAAVDWLRLEGLSDYGRTLAAMEAVAADIAAGRAPEQVWLLEHPPLYTAGTKARDGDLLDGSLPVHRTGRGGEFTYHGPGQRVAYVMLDLARRQKDVRAYVAALEEWIAGALDGLNVRAERREDRVGLWVARPEKAPLPDGQTREDKIAAIGVRLRRWVTFHGVSVNVEPDLSNYGGIVPCGVRGHGITSLADLGLTATLEDLDEHLHAAFAETFGAVGRTRSIRAF